MKIPIIETIRLLASQSNSKVVRRPVADEKPFKVLSNILPTVLVDKTMVDIPISAIGNMSRTRAMKVPKQEPTWLGTLREYIHGKDWADEVLDYFANEIKSHPFPASGAQGTLQVNSYNGVCFGRNGNHRLVGLVCYLAAKYGDNSIAKCVEHQGVVYDEEVLSKLRKIYGCATNGIRLISRLGLSDKLKKEVDNIINIDNRFYTFDGNDFVLLWTRTTEKSNKSQSHMLSSGAVCKFETQRYTLLNHNDCTRLFTTTWLIDLLAAQNERESVVNT